MSAIVASPTEMPLITDIITEAFLSDPVWSWVFPNPQNMRAYWAMLIKSALRYPFVFHTNSYEAASVWIPPGESTFLPEDNKNFEQMLEKLCGDRASEVAAFLVNFDEARPTSEPHFYLALLGTATQHRGKGLGMSLLSETLKLMDERKMPVYLESSNSMNNLKYETLGFEPISSFHVPEDGTTVTGMWRSPRSRPVPPIV